MTALRFDFDKAAADARADFPEQTKGITFINLDAPDVAAQMQKFYDGLSDTAKSHVDAQRRANPDFLTPNAMPTVWKTMDGQGMLLAYGSRSHLCEAEKIAFDPAEAAKQLKYTFDHELGHLVVKNADKPTNRAEHGADAFAVLRGMQSAFLTQADVRQIADGRDMLGWLNADVTHITSMSLDALLINKKQTDFLSLTPQQTAQIAARHAETFALETDVSSFTRLITALPRYGFTMDQIRADRLENLGDLALKEDRSSLGFYYAARMLLTAKAKHDAGDLLAAKADFSGEKWDKVFAAIDKKAQHRDIGASHAVAKNPGAPEVAAPRSVWQKIQMKMKPLKV